MDDKPKEIIKDQPEWMLKSTVTGTVRNRYYHNRYHNMQLSPDYVEVLMISNT